MKHRHAVAIAAIAVTPVFALCGVVFLVAAISASSISTVAAASAVCTYAYPDADRIAATIGQLTDEPVQPDQWNRYAPLTGIDPDIVSWNDSTPAQRDAVLTAAVRQLLYTNTPAAVTTPAVTWWYGELPVDADTTWGTTPVPGWNGTLDTYIAALVDTYGSDPALNDGAGHTCIPPYATACRQPANLDAVLATIRHLESGDNYTEQRHSVASGYDPGSGNPSGAYQFLASSWNRYGGFAEAFLAPPAVQDERAASDVDAILTAFNGDPAWVPVAWYVGLAGARNVADGAWSPAFIPNPAHNTISIGDYQARWLDHYTNLALPAAGTAPAECPQGGLAAVAWAETQIGSPYAAIDPYRFGTPTWPGGTLTGSRGDPYTFPAGTTVYDCSGFVIAAWRAAGTDLVAEYGLYGSQAFPASPLEEISPAAITPGDLAVYSPVNGVGHIVMIHHIDPDGTVRTIEASTSHGVRIGTINWSRVTSIKRPPTVLSPQGPNPPTRSPSQIRDTEHQRHYLPR